MDIRSLIDSLERALGPNATVDQVEKLAQLFLANSISHSNGTANEAGPADMRGVPSQPADHLLVFANGRDRPGILAGVSSAIADLGCNIVDVEQSVSGGHFVLMMRVDGGAKGISAAEAQSGMANVAQQLHISVVVQHAELFEAMNFV